MNAANAHLSLVFYRIASLGWGSMFAFFLHLILVYTKKQSIRSKIWSYVLLFAPSAILIYVFALSKSLVEKQYHLVKTTWGWIDKAPLNGWDFFFMIIALTELLLGLLFFTKREKRETTNVLQQKKPMFFSLEKISQSELMLTSYTRKKVYQNLSNALFVAALVSFIDLYSVDHNLLNTTVSSGFMILLGIGIRRLKKLTIKDSQKDSLLLLLMFISIPSIRLMNIEYSSVSIWALSILFIVITIVFNSPTVLCFISISALATESYVWMIHPYLRVELNEGAYLGRFGVLAAIIGIAFSVNQLMIRRLKANLEQLNLQRFISEVTSDFISANQENIQEKMSWVLRIVGKLYQIDRISFLYVEKSQCKLKSITVWSTDSNELNEEVFYESKDMEYAYLANQLVKKEYLQVSDVNQLSLKANDLKEWLKERKITAFVAIPILEKKNHRRILLFSVRAKERIWKTEEIETIKIISNIFSDALMKVEAEKEVNFMAYHDQLTGLPNRRLLKDRVGQAIELAKRTERLIGIVFVDLDSFKAINDTLGHEGGDALLKLVSKRLSQIVRLSDTVSRFGGDEFILMINHISTLEDLKHVVGKIAEALKETVEIDGQEFRLTQSMGVSVYPFDGEDLDTLIRNADIAMYKAKESGKNRWMMCTKDLKAETLEKIKITNSLYHALERNEFYLQYQPQIHLETGKIIGVEALLRWNHSQLGPIAPSIFIPIAEQIGMISSIGNWVLYTAAEQNQKWREKGYAPITMAVNVSAKQLRHETLLEQLKKVLEQTNLPPKYLEIEITESAAMSDASDVVGLLDKVKKLGITLSIDDFGTHYSSLGRLRDLPIDKIKIDKKFVDGINHGKKNDAIVRTIINLGKNLNLHVIAEGVEQEEQQLFLFKEGCDQIQGYYYHKPLHANEIEQHLVQDI